MTFQTKNRSQSRNSTNLVFFISVAFALIPANFITIIIKERELNTKHLQIISGITTSSYWISNFIFEFLKYFFTGGICLILIVAFGVYEDNLILLVFLYGLSMVSFTYIAGQMKGVGVAFSSFLGVPFNVGIFIGGLIVFIYAVLGGMKGVTYTQVAQYVV